MDTATFESIAKKLSADETLSDDDIANLSATRDLVQLGALADERRRAKCGDRVTFVRVLEIPLTRDLGCLEVPSSAGEVRLTGCPDTADAAVRAVEQAVARADTVPVSGFDLEDLVRLSGEDVTGFERFVRRLAESGLARVAEMCLDRGPDSTWLRRSAEAGVAVARVTVYDRAVAGANAARRVASWGKTAFAQAFAPLARELSASPSTGYEDVRQVALARLLVDNIPSIQVDWRRYGPKLAQVALVFGADDVDGVSPIDSLEHGRRRAPLEEITQNIRAASLVPVQRNGRFEPLAYKQR